MKLTRKQAYDFIEAVKTAREVINDDEASKAVGMYPMMHNDGELIHVGTRINWDGVLKRAAVDLYDREENNPDKAPTLWEDIIYSGEIRVIPDTITVGLSFKKGEHGMWKGREYESLMDNNVYTPEQYLAGWKEVTKK